MPPIHKAKDNSIKMVLDEPEMFVAFLRNFVPMEIFKDIEPSDIEDVTSRFLTLVSEQKDSDTVKRIHLKGDTPLFVIAIIEHETKVNYRAPFKMLLYIALVLDAYEKEVAREAKAKAAIDASTSTVTDTTANTANNKLSIATQKDFKYPPILPIVFYDGENEWTAETNFLYKTEMHDIFEKYIPKFEYELVSLKDHTVESLAKFGDVLSLFMILDKIKTPGSLSSILSALPSDYVEHLKLNVPDHLKKLLANVIRVLLAKINVPQDEIDRIAENIHERGVSEMFSIENYDVQETRRIAREEGREEGIEKGFLEAAIRFIEKGLSLQDVAETLKLTDSQIAQVREAMA